MDFRTIYAKLEDWEQEWLDNVMREPIMNKFLNGFVNNLTMTMANLPEELPIEELGSHYRAHKARLIVIKSFLDHSNAVQQKLRANLEEESNG